MRPHVRSRRYRFDDCAWVANRWCELLSSPPPRAQGLMQLDNPLLRLELVGDFAEPQRHCRRPMWAVRV